jgi:DNA-binding NtrC family response regulator
MGDRAMSQDRLFAFVDLKDPFMQTAVLGEDRPGPILSILETRRFASVVMLYTGQTKANARGTEEWIKKRFPDCECLLRQLPVRDPKDYSALMSAATHAVRQVNDKLPPAANFVCVSSGTAEMRAVWFLLTAAGILSASLLHVGSPAEPLFGAAGVKETTLDSGDWSNLRDLLMPNQYFGSPEESDVEIAMMATPRLDYPQAERDFESPRVSHAARKKASILEHGLAPESDELDAALEELGITIASASMRHAAETAMIAAGEDFPVLILGETGTGKELFAKLVHRLSNRRGKPMVTINCAAIPQTLMESHLFGHVKGSFTGATNDHKGKFEQADGGTLFLDELGELPADAQAKLLRILDDKLVEAIGSMKPRKVDVRIIAATNRNLPQEVAKKQFRDDLYFRLSSLKIELPPLRDRIPEIASLAAVLLNEINARRLTPCRLSKDALRRLEQHSWRGNVRELRAVLQRSVLLAGSDVLQPEHVMIESPPPKADIFDSLPDPAPGFSLDDFLARMRARLIRNALQKTNLNQSEAAKLLGISKQAVNQFLKLAPSS